MNYDRILIRYGELSTKGRNRYKFVERLKNNILGVLKTFPKIEIESTRDRMYIILHGEDGDEVVERLQHIFGIQSYSPAVKTTTDIEEMKDTSLKLMQRLVKKDTTFKVNTRRADKNFQYDTNELNHMIGSHLLRNITELSVDVKNPEITFTVEVRTEGVYLSAQTIKGAGGMPIGTSGKAMLMLSGGIDSPVAGFLTLKRGVDVEAVHFYSPPFTSERSKQKVVDLCEKLSQVSGSVKLHVVPFTEIQQLIQKQVPENYTMTTTRRLMLRITDEIRRKNNGLAIVTGESLGQVASQTLESMLAINDVTNTPVLRPVIAMDKTEIIEIAKQIDTHEISNRPYEDCCTVFTPAMPKTKPKRDKVKFYESFVDFDTLIEKAVTNTEMLEIHPGYRGKEKEIDDLF